MNLDVKLIQENKTHSFKFNVKVEEQFRTILHEKITFRAENEFKLQVLRYYFVIITPDKDIRIIKENSLFLPQYMKSENISIYGVATSSTGYSFAKKENFTLGHYEDSEVKLVFEEEQRYRK